jgi:hypothetical protein
VKYLCSVIAVVFAAVNASSAEGLPILGSVNWARLTNAANFHEVYSTTNLPPQVRAYILRILGNMGAEPSDREKIAEPGDALSRGSRLVWAATDNTNWVVHYEFVCRDGPRAAWTMYCVTAGFPALQGTGFDCWNGGYPRRLKNYKAFADYEGHR